MSRRSLKNYKSSVIQYNIISLVIKSTGKSTVFIADFGAKIVDSQGFGNSKWVELQYPLIKHLKNCGQKLSTVLKGVAMGH